MKSRTESQASLINMGLQKGSLRRYYIGRKETQWKLNRQIYFNDVLSNQSCWFTSNAKQVAALL